MMDFGTLMGMNVRASLIFLLRSQEAPGTHLEHTGILNGDINSPMC